MEAEYIKVFNDKLDEEMNQMLPELEAIYKDIHQNPELSMQEFRTAKIAAWHLTQYHYEVSTGIGVTGVVGVMKNGEGPVVMVRADMDALPVTEATGLNYASTVKAKDEEGNEAGVSHVCGHDMHVTWMIGVAKLFSGHKDLWKGTLLVVFQPGEEVGRGAQSMIDDGMMNRFPKPDIILGQHVMVGEAGTVGHRGGPILTAGDSLKVKLFGRGAHGSFPQTSIDPVVMAAATTMRLQTIVSREIAPGEMAVLTIGSLQAGIKENIIPDDATLKLNIRTFDEGVRDHILSAVKRICRAESSASNAPREPVFTPLDSYPVTSNDVAATMKLAEAFDKQFGERSFITPPASASEDFSIFGRNWKVPYVFWFVGGTDPETYLEAKKNNKINTIPSNHSPKFCPVLHPTLKTGLQAMTTAAAAWLDKNKKTDPLFSLYAVIDLTGTFAFAISGAAAAKEKKLDIFGILVVAFTVACGGGITRDLCIGAIPPAGLSDWRYLLVSVIAALIVIELNSLVKLLNRPIIFFDALGLSLFAVSGAEKALSFGHNNEVAVLLGIITAVGGGVIRDIFLNRIPVIFEKEIYASAALLGALVFVAGHYWGLPSGWISPIGFAVCLVLRLLALKYHWKLPAFTRKKQ